MLSGDSEPTHRRMSTRMKQRMGYAMVTLLLVLSVVACTKNHITVPAISEHTTLPITTTLATDRQNNSVIATATIPTVLTVHPTATSTPIATATDPLVQNQQWIFTSTIGSELPPFVFKLEAQFADDFDQEVVNVNSIEIIKGRDTSSIQVIDSLEETTTPIKMLIMFEDMNFDSYKDFRILKFGYGGPHLRYLYWFFDIETQKFIRKVELESLIAPEFIADTKTIQTFWRVNAANYEIGYYRFVDDELVIVRQERRAYIEEGVYNLTVLERVEGEMQVIKQETVQE